MGAVSNTSPILNLAIIGRLSLLRQQFSQIVLPPAVLLELRLDRDLPGVSELRRAIDENWMRVQEVDDRFLVQSLTRDLDQGEAEAIALACQIRSPWLLLDEHDGRRAAKSLGLRVIGTLGVLLRGYHEGHISSLRHEVENLRDQAGFRISEALVSDLLRRTGQQEI